MMHRDEEIRPFFGESAEVIEGPSWTAERQEHRSTFQQDRALKIAEGLCPYWGCGGTLDESFFCSQCGGTSLPLEPVDDLEEERLTWWPLALALDHPRHPVDEYAPAEVDAA